ncbi:unnamed protein product, partial [Brassica rapa]
SIEFNDRGLGNFASVLDAIHRGRSQDLLHIVSKTRMCSNWLLMKIEEDEGGRPRRIYSIGKRQSHRKSSLRKPMIKRIWKRL